MNVDSLAWRTHLEHGNHKFLRWFGVSWTRTHVFLELAKRAVYKRRKLRDILRSLNLRIPIYGGIHTKFFQEKLHFA